MKALLSVADRTGIVGLAHGLVELGWEVYSTGGTGAALAAAGVPVQSLEALTAFPEILDGRVKTLHPAVHGGILARRDRASDLAELREHGLAPLDLVANNLYPFAATVASPDATHADILENIDIGGVTLLRAAAKNYRDVVPLCRPQDYKEVLAALREQGSVGEALRLRLATLAFPARGRVRRGHRGLLRWLAGPWLGIPVIRRRDSLWQECRVEDGDVGEIAVALLVVEAIAHDERIGHVETHVINRPIRDPAGRLIQERTELERGGLSFL